MNSQKSATAHNDHQINIKLENILEKRSTADENNKTPPQDLTYTVKNHKNLTNNENNFKSSIISKDKQLDDEVMAINAVTSRLPSINAKSIEKISFDYSDLGPDHDQILDNGENSTNNKSSKQNKGRNRQHVRKREIN